MASLCARWIDLLLRQEESAAPHFLHWGRNLISASPLLGSHAFQRGGSAVTLTLNHSPSNISKALTYLISSQVC